MAMFANNYLQQSEKPNYKAHQLLWPVNVWLVYTSQPQGRQLNLFEKTILEILNVSGRRQVTNGQIAEWLGLETDMVSYIITAQLTPNGYLTSNGQVTENGKSLLADELNDNLTTAYVFQCAITGEWLPRVSFTLNNIYPISTNGHPKFKLSRGSDYVEISFIVKSTNNYIDPPSEEELNEIIINFRDDLFIAKNTRDIEFDTQGVDNLTLASNEATPAYLTVWGDISCGFEWTTYDPFNISTYSTWMADLFKKGCESDPSLARYALAKLGGTDTTLSYEEACLKFAEAAKLKVLVSYSDANKIEGLTEALYPMLEDYEKVKESDNPNYSTNAALVTKCIIIVENICEYALKQYSLQNPHRLPKPNTKNPKEILKGLITNATKMNKKMLDEVLKVAPSKVFNAAKCRNSTVRAQLAAIFISMESYLHHPLSFLLEDQTYFVDLYNLTFLRDDCAHKNPPKVSNQQINKAVSLIDTFLNKLFIGLTKNG